jgi:catecholate siderophore receptor
MSGIFSRALVIIAFLVPLPAQPSSTLLEGRIVDPAGSPIAGARVSASREGDASAVLATNEGGEFSWVLTPGAYTLTVRADGFTEAIRTVHVTAGPLEPLVIQLQVAPQHEMVTVTDRGAYQVATTRSATRTPTPLLDIPQSISVVPQDLIRDQMMMSIGDVVRYVPGVTAIQGENNRDQVVIRGNSSSADFFVNGVRDDVQYYRDLYNLERVEVLKGPHAMVFGRGGGGGVINRVTKEAGAAPLQEITLQGGSFGNKRLTTDFDHTVNDRAALRFNGLYENSGSFRRFVNLERYGLNPTVTLAPTQRTKVTLGYEYFGDRRTADRGIPSFQGLPADVPRSQFFGDPDNSRVRADVHLGSASVEHQVGRLNIRNRTLAADYDRGYQNYVPGVVNAQKTEVSLSAYNNATRRRNVFNQTDVTYTGSSGPLRHTLLWGAEFGGQRTANFRNTGFFGGTATSIAAPYADSVLHMPVTFRQNATDADNRIRTGVAATYVQDQVELSRYVQLVAGVRFDRFDLRYHNNRTSEDLQRIDNLVSPRAGVVVKPVASVSIYGDYSVSWLPSSGDQFSSLTTITQQVKPEKFSNYEGGVKWDLARSLSLTAAVYRLDRTNTRATDPNDPTRIVQTGSQQTNGLELGWNGSMTRKWRVAGGYAHQDAFITSATAAARLGAQAAQVPHHTFSVWNHYQIVPRLSAGLGVLSRSDMFAAVDNTVVLPGYTRADAAVYYAVTEKLRLQANVENLFNRRYYLHADGNNNISPGFSRAIRVGLIARF